MPNPDDFICGGYFLVRQIARPKDITELVPETFLTLSGCFAGTAPGDWAVAGYNYDDQERAVEASQFFIPAAAVPELVKLLSDALGMQHSNAFPSFAVAQTFYRHCANKTEVALVGIGLHRSLLPSLYAQRSDDINRGYGLLERVELNNPLAHGVEALGYEPLGFDATSFHSWLCHNAPIKALEVFGIQPNSKGLIESLDDAVRVTEHLKKTGAEKAIWEPWLVVRYATESRNSQPTSSPI